MRLGQRANQRLPAQHLRVTLARCRWRLVLDSQPQPGGGGQALERGEIAGAAGGDARERLRAHPCALRQRAPAEAPGAHVLGDARKEGGGRTILHTLISMIFTLNSL